MDNEHNMSPQEFLSDLVSSSLASLLMFCSILGPICLFLSQLDGLSDVCKLFLPLGADAEPQNRRLLKANVSPGWLRHIKLASLQITVRVLVCWSVSFQPPFLVP